ncbi:hypothetical protein E2C01_068000 [Portunus trituberculatus]|uniref:Uncharacterized protein n=1 Tax=Portunus trituberculatus TaxID=210409 RepID=A0A5B7HYX8_PORTR|nr:hypothetical protein [Portunus trituberculatus]
MRLETHWNVNCAHLDTTQEGRTAECNFFTTVHEQCRQGGFGGVMWNGGVVPGGPEWWRAGDAWQWCWRNGHIGFGRRQKTAAGNIIYYRRHATGLSLAMEGEACIAGGRGVSDAAAT